MGDYTDASTGTTWTSVWSEDFNTNVPLSAANWDPIAGQGLPKSNPYYGKFSCYERPIKDTAGIGYYYTEKTSYTDGSIFHINNHSDVIPETGTSTPLGGTIIPLIGPDYYSTFIRAQYRIRVVSNGAGYGGVWLMINSNNWPAYGEFDFPEGELSGSLSGYYHYADPNGGQLTVSPSNPAQNYSDWHTVTQQWEPGRLRWWVDSTLYLDTTDRVPDASMPLVFMLQSGTQGYAPSTNVSADIQVDWISIWKHPLGTV